jgi:hypothetical protein
MGWSAKRQPSSDSDKPMNYAPPALDVDSAWRSDRVPYTPLGTSEIEEVTRLEQIAAAP